MRGSIRALCVRAFAVSCLVVAPHGRAAAQTLQSWNEVDVTASWHRVDLLVPFLARTDTNLPNPQLAASGFTADFPLPWRLTLTGGYLFADLPQRSEWCICRWSR